MARRDCMSNECQRIITLHAPAEIRSILQIKENISIRHQTLTQLCWKGHGRCTFPSRITISRKVQVKLFTSLQYLMKNSSTSNRIDREAIKVPSSLGL